MKTRRRPYTAQLQRVTSTLFGCYMVLGPTSRDTDERDHSGLYAYAIHAAWRSDVRMLEVLCDLGSPMNRTWVNEDEECGDGHVDTPARVALGSDNIDGLAFLRGPKHRGIWIRKCSLFLVFFCLFLLM